jgi:hypothetical protein
MLDPSRRPANPNDPNQPKNQFDKCGRKSLASIPTHHMITIRIIRLPVPPGAVESVVQVVALMVTFLLYRQEEEDEKIATINTVRFRTFNTLPRQISLG